MVRWRVDLWGGRDEIPAEEKKRRYFFLLITGPRRQSRTKTWATTVDNGEKKKNGENSSERKSQARSFLYFSKSFSRGIYTWQLSKPRIGPKPESWAATQSQPRRFLASISLILFTGEMGTGAANDALRRPCSMAPLSSAPAALASNQLQLLLCSFVVCGGACCRQRCVALYLAR